MDLKSTLKTVKLYESSISMILGAIILATTALLVVTYFRGLNTGKTLKTGANTETVSGETYKVVKGDSLWSISEKYYGDGSKWTKIAEVNKIVNPNQLEEGMELSLPKIETKVGDNKFLQPEVSSPGAISGDSYTVIKGDTLWDIAVRAYGDGYRWTELASVNKLSNPNLIHPGNVFSIPR